MPRIYHCPECNEFFPSKEKYEEHSRDEHPEPES